VTLSCPCIYYIIKPFVLIPSSFDNIFEGFNYVENVTISISQQRINEPAPSLPPTVKIKHKSSKDADILNKLNQTFITCRIAIFILGSCGVN